MAPRNEWSRAYMLDLEFRRIAQEINERRAQVRAVAAAATAAGAGASQSNLLPESVAEVDASQSNLLPESVAEVDSRKLSPAELEFHRIARELNERRAQEKAAGASQSNLLPESVAEVDSRKLSPTAQAVN